MDVKLVNLTDFILFALSSEGQAETARKLIRSKLKVNQIKKHNRFPDLSTHYFLVPTFSPLRRRTLQRTKP